MLITYPNNLLQVQPMMGHECTPCVQPLAAADPPRPGDAFDLSYALIGKGPIRTLLKGGPILQPPKLWVFREDWICLRSAVPTLRAARIAGLRNKSADRRFVHPADCA